MDFLESSLTFPSVPSDPVAPIRLKKKRGPAPSDRPDPALGEPLLDQLEETGRAVTLLDKLRRFATLCLWPQGESDELLVPTGRKPGLFRCLITTLKRTVRACCETVINGFIWSAEARPY